MEIGVTEGGFGARMNIHPTWIKGENGRVHHRFGISQLQTIVGVSNN